MEKKHTLLLYEKEIFLNSILQEQFLYSEDYQLFIAQNEKKLLEMINNRLFDFFILNLDIVNNNLSTFLENFKEYRMKLILSESLDYSLEILNDISNKFSLAE